MVSLTLRHLRRDDFNEPLSILKAAFRLFGSRCKRIWEKLGVAGEAKALEVLVGRHGPHYHYHVALIYKPPEKFDSLDTEALHHTLNTIVRNLREMWTRCVLDSGGEVNGFGFDWRQDTPLSYLAKELAAEDTKRRQGLTLIQLLNRFEHHGDLRAGQDYLDGIDALSGAHHLQLGDLPKKMGLMTFTKWNKNQVKNRTVDPPRLVIEYPTADHVAAARSPPASLTIITDRAAKAGAA